jgi:ribosomal protein S27AE
MNDNHAAAWGILLAFLDVGFLTLLAIILIIALSWSERSPDRRRAGGTDAGEHPSAMVLLRRALARHCPVCGKGAMFRSYFAMNESCGSCGAIFWKNEGEWMGPMVMDYIVAGAAALLSWLATSWFDLSELTQFHRGRERNNSRRITGDTMVTKSLDRISLLDRGDGNFGDTKGRPRLNRSSALVNDYCICYQAQA